MVDIWENLVKTKKVRVLIYFEEMKNLLIHNCIGSHTNCFMSLLGQSSVIYLDKYLNKINKCYELQNQCIGGMLCWVLHLWFEPPLLLLVRVEVHRLEAVPLLAGLLLLAPGRRLHPPRLLDGLVTGGQLQVRAEHPLLWQVSKIWRGNDSLYSQSEAAPIASISFFKATKRHFYSFLWL